MTKFTPYLLFKDNCAEALEFYKSIFGGELGITKVSDSSIKDKMSEGMQNRVIYAHFRSGVIEFSASDWMHPTRKPIQGNTVCLYISEGTHEELKGYFDKLSVGADPETLDALSEHFFGVYGALTDKYGIRWMFKADQLH